MTERERIIERLHAVDLGGGSHESLSAIAKAIYEPVGGWTIGACEKLSQTLVRLLGEADTPTSGERITNELRRLAEDPLLGYASQETHKEIIIAIADRIDAAHQKAIASVMNDALYHANDKDMADLGWYRALDADKKPVRIGAEMDSDHYEGGTVVGLQFFNTANKTPRVLIAILPHGWNTPTWRDPDSYHYKQPTVEDVLQEFADEVQRCCDTADTIAEYAKRLKLAGSDAE